MRGQRALARGAAPLPVRLGLGRLLHVGRHDDVEGPVLEGGVLEIFALAIADSTKAQEEATDDDPWAHEWMNSQGAAGFGPYKLKEWTKGQEMIFEVNENWAATVSNLKS